MLHEIMTRNDVNSSNIKIEKMRNFRLTKNTTPEKSKECEKKEGQDGCLYRVKR